MASPVLLVGDALGLVTAIALHQKHVPVDFIDCNNDNSIFSNSHIDIDVIESLMLHTSNELALLAMLEFEADLSKPAIASRATNALSSLRGGSVSCGFRAICLAYHLPLEHVTMINLEYLAKKTLQNILNPKRALCAFRCLTSQDDYLANELAYELKDTEEKEKRKNVEKIPTNPPWVYMVHDLDPKSLMRYARAISFQKAELATAVHGRYFGYYSALSNSLGFRDKLTNCWHQPTNHGGYGIAPHPLMHSKARAIFFRDEKAVPSIKDGFQTPCLEIDEHSITEESLRSLVLDGPYGYGRMIPYITCRFTLTDYHTQYQKIRVALTTDNQVTFSGFLYHSDAVLVKLKQLLDSKVTIVARVVIPRASKIPELAIASIQ